MKLKGEGAKLDKEEKSKNFDEMTPSLKEPSSNNRIAELPTDPEVIPSFFSKTGAEKF